MKKVIFLVAILLTTLLVTAQTNKLTLCSNYDVSTATDTFWQIPINSSYTWQFYVVWDTFGGTLDAVFSIDLSGDDGSTYTDYYGMDTVITSTASGQTAFEDWMFSGDRLRLYFTKNNVTSGTFSVYAILKNSK